MTEKCKLNDLAKDLGVSNKELIDLIEARFGEQKKATAVLVDQELNYVVEYYSKKGEVKSFDQYFADGEKKRAERLAPKPAEQKKPQEKPAEKQAHTEKKPEPKKAEAGSCPSGHYHSGYPGCGKDRKGRGAPECDPCGHPCCQCRAG